MKNKKPITLLLMLLLALVLVACGGDAAPAEEAAEEPAVQEEEAAEEMEEEMSDESSAEEAMEGGLEGRDLIMDGGSMIVAPGGKVIAGPVVAEETILTAEVDEEEILAAQLKLDPAGHYNRPDVLQLRVNRERREM